MTLRIIAGVFKGRLLKSPKGPATRPTQNMLREAVFNICQNEIADARFLDLFAGSGAMAFEALSRGASHAVLVEQNRHAIAAIRENIAILHLTTQITLLPHNATRALAQLHKQHALFDIIYIDPPYDHPFDPAPLLPLLAPHATLFWETDATRPPPTLPPLTCTSSRHFAAALLSVFGKSS
jgi:16S rRNA (guanine(966)-N(2))-methyltransferase RsmD